MMKLKLQASRRGDDLGKNKGRFGKDLRVETQTFRFLGLASGSSSTGTLAEVLRLREGGNEAH